MFFDVAYLILGFLALYFGAEWLVKGSASLARSTGIRPIIIALTVVAFGTSAPELFVSINAAVAKSPDIVVGNIIGSTIANICLILGLSAIVRPIQFEFRLLRQEIPIMIACESLFLILAWNLELSRIDGILLIIAFLLFNIYCIREALSNTRTTGAAITGEYDQYISRQAGSRSRSLILATIGIMTLVAGSYLSIKGAVAIADHFGISAFIIAASIIAFGTSLPELATSVVAAARGEFDISVGNVLGSNIFNILLCIGVAALISPIAIKHSVVRIDTLMMIGVSFVLGIFMWSNRRISRLEGIVLLFIYAGYLTYLFH